MYFIRFANIINRRTFAVVMGMTLCVGCVGMGKPDTPALRVKSSNETENTATQQVINHALSQLLHAPVQVSEQIFTQTPTLLLAAQQPTDSTGKPLDGKVLKPALPEQIDLIQIGQQCYLQRLSTRKKILLKGMMCRIAEAE